MTKGGQGKGKGAGAARPPQTQAAATTDAGKAHVTVDEINAKLTELEAARAAVPPEIGVVHALLGIEIDRLRAAMPTAKGPKTPGHQRTRQ